ncbi:hypothetical protein LCGC14_1179000 [marine sediment metagenome]|uniref:Uncharacterized protein n=1 Tax=marine sediment metagenome TaxID=412755 RepID=A0A0F9MAK0_9ZZZZ
METCERCGAKRRVIVDGICISCTRNLEDLVIEREREEQMEELLAIYGHGEERE